MIPGVQKHRNYTTRELLALRGDTSFASPPVTRSPKPVIATFKQFSCDDRAIYRKVRQALRKANPGARIEVAAFGSRVKGTWRSSGEEEAMAAAYGFHKPSDYDIATTAAEKPTIEQLQAAGLQGIRLDWRLNQKNIEKPNHVVIPPTLMCRIFEAWHRLQAMCRSVARGK